MKEGISFKLIESLEHYLKESYNLEDVIKQAEKAMFDAHKTGYISNDWVDDYVDNLDKEVDFTGNDYYQLRDYLNKVRIDNNLNKFNVDTFTVTNYNYDNNMDTAYGKLKDGNYYYYFTEEYNLLIYDTQIPQEYIDYLYNDEYSRDDYDKLESIYNEFNDKHNVSDNYDYSLIDDILGEVSNIYYDYYENEVKGR